MARAVYAPSGARALAAAWVLHATGALAYGSDASPIPTSAEPAIEILVSEEAAPAGVAASRDVAPQRAASKQEDALRGEIESRFARLDELDHYALLGVTSHATTAQIRAAYHDAARRYHPDALARAAS